MYYEEANVKEYFRKDSKGNKKPYYQINLKKKSKFNEVKPVAIVDISEMKELIEAINTIDLNQLEANLDGKEREIVNLKQELQQFKEANSKLTSENYDLQQQLISVNKNYENKLEEIASEKETSKKLLASITNLTSEKAEIEKENIFLKNRNLFNRIINKKYESENNKLPENVEVNVN